MDHPCMRGGGATPHGVFHIQTLETGGRPAAERTTPGAMDAGGDGPDGSDSGGDGKPSSVQAATTAS